MNNPPTPGEWSASESDAKKDHESGQSHPQTPDRPHFSGLGIGPCGAPDAAAKAAAPAPAGLPCQNSNNSDKRRPRYRLKPLPHSEDFYRVPGHDRAVWRILEDGDTLQRWGFPTSAEAKAAFHLRQNVAAFVAYWGRNHVLFFTLTDEANLHPKLFARRWNNYLRRHGAWIVSFIRVLEPQAKGRPHYHVLVAVSWDTRPDAFDWEAFDGCQHELRANGRTARFRELRARYKASAAAELTALWPVLRKVLPHYGLGRAEVLPMRKGKEAISEYVGKYLEAGLVLRKHSWKGCRRVEFDRRGKVGWLTCTRVFAWHSPGAKAWRQRVAQLGTILGLEDISELSSVLGRRWAYRMREAITFSSPDDWTLLLEVLADLAQ